MGTIRGIYLLKRSSTEVLDPASDPSTGYSIPQFNGISSQIVHGWVLAFRKCKGAIRMIVGIAEEQHSGGDVVTHA